MAARGWWTSPLPYAAQVEGMNCIGPWAPEALGSRRRPKSDSTKFTAASTCHATPLCLCPSMYSARSRATGSAEPSRTGGPGFFGARRRRSRRAMTSSVTSRASRDGSRRTTARCSAGLLASRSSTSCSTSAACTVTRCCSWASARTSCAARSAGGGGGVGIRELEVRRQLLDVAASVVREQRTDCLERLDREPSLLEVEHLPRELSVRERAQHRARAGEEVRDLQPPEVLGDLLEIRLRFAHPRRPA